MNNMNTSEICNDQQRRYLIQTHKDASGNLDLNGIDYVEISDDDPRVLLVHFLNVAPKNLLKANVSIQGGRRIRNIYAIDPFPQPCSNEDDPEPTHCLRITVNQVGDFSTYTLRLVEVDATGQPTDQILQGFDQRYAQAEFSFQITATVGLDCQSGNTTCVPADPSEPEINYLAKDYASFRQLILDRLALLMSDWQERHVPDVGITLVELLAYVGDYLSYYQDSIATEAYLETARQRISVRRHARLVDYDMHEGCNARAWVFIKTAQDMPVNPRQVFFITTPSQSSSTLPTALTTDDLRNIPLDDTRIFAPLFFPCDAQGQMQLYAAHNALSFYTWGNQQCFLPCGSTSATIRDEWVGGTPTTQTTTAERLLHLHSGDVLYFEEFVGVKTGNVADADTIHRHVVRLTQVERGVDTLYDPPVPVLEIAWAEDDALPFSLSLSADPNGVVPGIARGNIILVDAGAWQPSEALGVVEGKIAGKAALIPFTAQLQKTSLTFSVPLPEDAQSDQTLQQPVSWTSAMALLKQCPRQAIPQIQLLGELATHGDQIKQAWTAQAHLLESHKQDLHFVVEMDNDGRGNLRFGDGILGCQPEVGTAFTATYRTGNGVSGNVGADTISHIVFQQAREDRILKISNPLPASGGTDPEPLVEAKLFAPQAFRDTLLRAITPEDYVRLAEENPKVQQATAVFRWTGTGYQVLLALKQRGKEEVDPGVLEEVEMDLESYRCMGHELSVIAARLVPLDIAMTVDVLPGYLRAQVKTDLLAVFSNRKLPGGRYGFFSTDRLSLGESIPRSKLIGIAQTVPGVASVKITKLERIYQGTSSALMSGILPIGPFEIAQMDNNPDYPENGQLTITIRGGR